jgi:hypothetical protein
MGFLLLRRPGKKQNKNQKIIGAVVGGFIIRSSAVFALSPASEFCPSIDMGSIAPGAVV